MRRRIGVDLDNTLCKGQHWNTPEECFKAEPLKDRIEYVNGLYKDDFVIIYTARQNFLMSATFDWLDNNGVKYHAVSNRKTPFDLLIDDTAFWPWKE
ncbi:MAG: hypothetical protein WC479_02935 [Candidatus Izemoplasmatales bacterium]